MHSQGGLKLWLATREEQHRLLQRHWRPASGALTLSSGSPPRPSTPGPAEGLPELPLVCQKARSFDRSASRG